MALRALTALGRRLYQLPKHFSRPQEAAPPACLGSRGSFCLGGATAPACVLHTQSQGTHTPVPEAALVGCVDPTIHSSSRRGSIAL